MVEDGEVREQRCLQVSVMNGKRLGGAFYMAPSAEADDGRLDLCIAGEPKRGEMLGIILKYMKGIQDESPHIRTGRVKRITVEALAGSFAAHADGEIMCTAASSFEVECLPRQLQVITPPRESQPSDKPQ